MFALGTVVLCCRLRTLALLHWVVCRTVSKEKQQMLRAGLSSFRRDRDSLRSCRPQESSCRLIGPSAAATLEKEGLARRPLVGPMDGQLGDEFDEQHVFNHAVGIAPLLSKLPM